MWTAVDTDRTFLMPAIALADAHVAAGGATWLYLFTWTTTAFGGRMGAVHTLEIPFVFNNFALGASPELTGGPPAAHEPWGNGCIGHGPSSPATVIRRHDGIPAWSPYEPAERATMIFDTECAVVE